MAPRSIASSRSSDDRILDWQKDVSRSLSSASTVPSAASDSGSRHVHETRIVREVNPPALAASQTPSIYITRPEVSSVRENSAQDNESGNSKAVVGTLLGAAGGAAVAYAMMKAESEDEAVRKRAAAPPSQRKEIVLVERHLEAPRRHGEGSRSRPGQTTTGNAVHASVVGEDPSTISRTPRSDFTTLISTFVPAANTSLQVLKASSSKLREIDTRGTTSAQSTSGNRADVARTNSRSTHSRGSKPNELFASNAEPAPPVSAAVSKASANRARLLRSVDEDTSSLTPEGSSTVVPADSISNATSGRTRIKERKKSHTSRSRVSTSSASSRTIGPR
ncbi:MAG: hypothetical protein M1817_006681 [Caeruleum heppii]|nr:MAG: hypothetical protein M1817_006681 [Caeruleum heppii]